MGIAEKLQYSSCTVEQCYRSSYSTPECKLFSETRTDWTLQDKRLYSSRAIFDKGQQDNKYLQTVCSHSAHGPLCVQLSAAAVWNCSAALFLQADVWCDKTKKDSHRVLPFLCSSILLFLSPTITLFHIHALSFSLTPRLTGYWHVLGHLAGRQMAPSYSPAPAWPTLPTHLWAQQIMVRIKHSCVKQQALWHIATAKILNATCDEAEGPACNSCHSSVLQNIRRDANGEG